MIRTRLISAFLLITMIVACSKKKGDEPVDLGYDYFPIQTGATWIYKVDSLVYDDNTGHTTIDTFTYEYKEQITGTFTDVSGKIGQQLSRYYKLSDTDEWVQVNSWTLLRTEFNAEKVQENTRLVKLVFPLELNKRWNPNMFNAMGEEEYKVTFYNEPYATEATQYSSALMVTHEDEENAIEEIKRYEIYARNAGLVYSLSDSINTQTNGSRGYRFRLTLKSFTP
jgi:hypothetical protein